MKLIVGLGNPGKEYAKTRHNVGFMAIDSYCQKHNLKFKNKFNGLYVKTKINSEETIFLKPQNFMNLSGLVLKKYLDYFKINISDILVIYDDKDFEVGKIKIKPNGSSGGHKGVKDVISNLQTTNFKRIRVGISTSEKDIKTHVLGKFTQEEATKITKVVDTINQIISDYFKITFDNLMNKYNSR